jgi:ketosteroid isomerase-like protein
MARLPDADVLQRMVDAFVAGDGAALDALFTENAVWHEAGSAPPISGDHKGKAAIFEFFGRVGELSGGTFRPDVHDICASDAHGVMLFHSTGKRDGREMRTPQVLIAHIEGGKIAEVWNTIAEGESAWNDFWK